MHSETIGRREISLDAHEYIHNERKQIKYDGAGIRQRKGKGRARDIKVTCEMKKGQTYLNIDTAWLSCFVAYGAVIPPLQEIPVPVVFHDFDV